MRRIIALLLVGVTSLGLVSCKSAEEKEMEKIVQDSKIEKTIAIPNDLYVLDKFRKEIEKAGNQVSASKEANYSVIGAQNGYIFSVNGEYVEIYEYNEKNLNDAGKKAIEEAKAGTITIDGKSQKALYKDGLLLTNIEGHSNEDGIIEVFNKLLS